MKRGTLKVLAAIACAVLIGAMGAASWNQGEEHNIHAVAPNPCPKLKTTNYSRDKVLFEIERVHSVWGNYDKRTVGAKSQGGNS